MDNQKEVKIRYTEHEYGFAEMLHGRVARITRKPVFAGEKICLDAIVLLDVDPRERTPHSCGYPAIAEVLYKPFPCYTVFEHDDEEAVPLLLLLLNMLQADALVGAPGLLMVWHFANFDPVLLAKVIGMKVRNAVRTCDDEDLEEEEDGEVPAEEEPAG